MPDTQCVQLSGVFTASQTLTGGGRASWVFALKAGPGDGVQTVTASAFDSFGANGCTGTASSRTASFVLDDTGPVVTGALTPSPNPAGWNSSDVAIAWSATDGGSGVASGPARRGGAERGHRRRHQAAVAQDAVGNTGTGSVTVKLDKGSPVIAGSRSPAPNAAGWSDGPVTVNFTCSDAVSGIRSRPGATTVSDSGAGQSVTGTAVDNAGTVDRDGEWHRRRHGAAHPLRRSRHGPRSRRLVRRGRRDPLDGGRRRVRARGRRAGRHHDHR